MARVILDCDNTLGPFGKEIDDGLALLYLLGREEVELLGVTATFGNGTLEEVVTQTRWLLGELGREDIPLVPGEAARGEPPTPAAEFLASTVAQHPGEVTVLATGPLGNLRAAAGLDPAFFHNARQVVCMGGIREPLRIGLRTLPELNFSANPEASAAVLGAPCPVTVMSAQVCLQAAFGWRDLRRVRGWRPAFRRAVRRWLIAFGLYCGVPRFYLWDLLPAVYVTHPGLFSEEQVTLDASAGPLRAGRLAEAAGGGAHVRLPARITDIDRFRALLFETWAATAG